MKLVAEPNSLRWSDGGVGGCDAAPSCSMKLAEPNSLRRATGSMKLAGAIGVVASALAMSLVYASTATPVLRVWQLEDEQVAGADADVPLPVGSLQKPFVAEAWARAHPGQVPGLGRCDARSHCWRPSGHGVLGLERALALSCNTYFRRLAAETPTEVLEATLRARGFTLQGTLTPALAIGLPDADATITITPAALLHAYRDLTRTPWSSGEPLRQRLLLGLREAARSGTARELGLRGYWAKTGTVPALDGQPLRTAGWALALDETGFGLLALLSRGTGHEAAAALQPTLARLRPWTATLTETRARTVRIDTQATLRRVPRRSTSPPALDDLERRGVRVRLFDALHPRRVRVRNLGDAPVAGSEGFVGSGARVALRPGVRLGMALWELSLPESGLVRRVQAALEVTGSEERPVIVAQLSAREYVEGVLAGEDPAADLRVDAGAAVLRYLLHGPRHADADVCDLTHCAFFIGRGPRVTWLSARLPVLLPTRPYDDRSAPDDWSRILELARAPGPSTWSSHCGGEPLAPYYVWGAGERHALPCPRHAPGSVAAWHRVWPIAALERALGAPVRSAAVDDSNGIWSLRVEMPGATRVLRFDEAHRVLAAELGWDALPSPARTVWRGPTGFEVEGVGFGHRVGLCLAGPDGTRAAASR